MNGVVDQPSFAEIYDGGGRRAPLPTDVVDQKFRRVLKKVSGGYSPA